MFINIDDNGLIHEIKVSKVALSISYLFFANDNFMICNFHIDEVREVKEILHTYCEISSQLVNFN